MVSVKPTGAAFVSPIVRTMLKEYMSARTRQHWREFNGDQNPASEIVATLQLRLDAQRAAVGEWRTP